MFNSSSTKSLRFVICPGRSPEKAFRTEYEKIYTAWFQLWSETYTELKNDEKLFADTFTRQDFVAAIFSEDQCQAFILFRHVDLGLKSSLQDSYFQQWSETHLKRISEYGNNILICGNLGIMPSARKNSLGFSMKDLMMGFITEIALHSRADLVISTPRKDRNVHASVYKWGGILIDENIDWGLDVIVDLTAFAKKNLLSKRDQEIMPLVNKLWPKMLVIPEARPESANSFIEYSKEAAISSKKAA